MKKLIAVCLFLLTLLLSACSSFGQATPTPVPTQTRTATLTRTPTRRPTPTPLPPTETPVVASEWDGIPIMPGAVAGEGDEEGYVFTIAATPQQIREYYELELGKLGWKSAVQGDGETSLTLIFTDDAGVTLTVSIIAKGDQSLVLLAK